MLQPGSLISRTAALAILAFIILAALQFAISPMLQAYQENRDTIATSKQLLQRYQALIAERPGLAERLEAIEAEGGNEDAYLKSADETLAAVELQDLVSSVVNTAGGAVKSVQILPAVDVEDGPLLQRSGVKLRFSADIEVLADTLYELESTEPILFIEHLQVSSARTRPASKGISAADVLDVRIDVFGYARRFE